MDLSDHNPPHQNSPLYERLKALPKVELHRHLEGSLRLSTLADVAREYRFELPGYEVEDFRPLVQIMPDDEHSSQAFLSKFETLRQFYQSQEVIERVAYEAVADAAADNIVYMELRFTPIALAREKGFELPEVASWVIDAVDRAKADFPIDVRLIVSMNRHESVELGAEHVDIAIQCMDRGVVGVDLAGAENLFPGAPFHSLFERAREAGLSVTIHAGEWAGPASISEAIDVLGATRLGHGVRIVEDLAVARQALERGTVFEVCPTSNVQSGVAPSFEEHPLARMNTMGLLTTVNTDDPGISSIKLTDEYVACVERLGLTIDDLKRQILYAAQAAFLPASDQAALMDRLAAELYAPGKPTETEFPAGND